MYYAGARFYSADLGRFLSADPLVPNAGNPQLLNRYAYAGNNPLRFTDPTGLRLADMDICWSSPRGCGGGGGSGGGPVYGPPTPAPCRGPLPCGTPTVSATPFPTPVFESSYFETGWLLFNPYDLEIEGGEGQGGVYPVPLGAYFVKIRVRITTPTFMGAVYSPTTKVFVDVEDPNRANIDFGGNVQAEAGGAELENRDPLQNFTQQTGFRDGMIQSDFGRTFDKGGRPTEVTVTVMPREAKHAIAGPYTAKINLTTNAVEVVSKGWLEP